MAFYLRQLAKYNMDTYIQINIILKGQEYIGVFFFKKIYFSFTRKYIPAEGKIHVYFNPQRFNAQIRKNKIYERDSELFSLTRGWGAGTVPLLRESSTPLPLLICAWFYWKWQQFFIMCIEMKFSLGYTSVIRNTAVKEIILDLLYLDLKGFI